LASGPAMAIMAGWT